MAPTAELEAELKVFEEHRKEWSSAHPGTYVVIQGPVILEEFFTEYGDAFKAGLKRFGVEKPFLIKQVWVTEPVYFVG